jgi:hypothetical protein
MPITFTSQLDELLTSLRQVCSRHYALPDARQQELPSDPSVFIEDVLFYVMDQWAQELRAQGHVLEQDAKWPRGEDVYTRYELRLVGGKVLSLLFTGEYPRQLFFSVSKGQRRPEQFSDARMAQVALRLSTDPNVLMQGILEGLKQYRSL